MGKSFYETHIKKEIFSKTTQKKFEAMYKDEDEDYIEYYRVCISNPDDCPWQFSSLWFFDMGFENGYFPIFVTGVNTSSYFAMELCGMERDEYEEENERTLEELLEEFRPSEKAKETIRQILELKKD